MALSAGDRDDSVGDTLSIHLAVAESKYLEIGWSDDGFYCAEKVTVEIALHALFWRNPAVLHVVAMDEDPLVFFPYSKRI